MMFGQKPRATTKELKFCIAIDADGTWGVAEDSDEAMEDLDADEPLHIYHLSVKVNVPPPAIPVSIDLTNLTPELEPIVVSVEQVVKSEG